MATHSSILAWRMPWTVEPNGLQFMGSQRVRHDSVTQQQLSGQDRDLRLRSTPAGARSGWFTATCLVSTSLEPNKFLFKN